MKDYICHGVIADIQYNSRNEVKGEMCGEGLECSRGGCGRKKRKGSQEINYFCMETAIVTVKVTIYIPPVLFWSYFCVET